MNTSYASGKSHPLIKISTPVQQNTWDDEKNQQIVNSLPWHKLMLHKWIKQENKLAKKSVQKNSFPACNFQIDFQFKYLINTNQISTWIKWLSII